MERLEAKRIKGHTYYYYSKWAKIDGRCRRVWQRYLGKLEAIVEAVQGGGPRPQYAELFQWGLPQALWQQCRRAEIAQHVDRHCPKRDQGLSTGEYLAIAAINRAISPRSKRSMWDWFSQTVLLRHFPQASKPALASQRFWDHMDQISDQAAAKIWQDILQGVIAREQIDLSSICYDGTNFYTFIDTFNTRCHIPRRGKNKQGRNNLRQVSYALFCCADGQLPLFYDVYQGNRNDTREFPAMIERFHQFFQQLSADPAAAPETTVVFDKGNNSAANFRLLDRLQVKFVGSVKLSEHRDLAEVKNSDARFTACSSPALEGTKAFRVRKTIAGRERLLVVTYNQNLFHAQWLTLQHDITKATDQLSALKQKLHDRAAGLLTGGRAPSVASVKKQCQTILKRPHLKKIIQVSVTEAEPGVAQLQFAIDAEALHRVSETYLGKTILVSNREEWEDERIIVAYRSQFLIEDVFKEMKDRTTGSWWPLHHWTDSKIRVHGLYCTVAVLLRALMCRRVQRAGVHLPLRRLLSELDAIREVVNIYPRKRGQRSQRKQSVLSKMSDLQQQLVSILAIDQERGTR